MDLCSGHPLGNEQVFVNIYQAHSQDFLAYLKDRSEDLLARTFAGV